MTEIKVITDKKDITVAQMKEQLKLLDVEVKSDKKDDVWAVYTQSREKLKIYAIKDQCIIKAFGDHGTSKLCEKCKAKQGDVYTACAEAAKAVTKQTIKNRVKSSRKMGHRTGDKLWGTRPNTMAKKFCQAVLNAGEAGISMPEARKARWNPKKYNFKETATRIVQEGFAELRDGRFYVTQLGIENDEAPAINE